MITLESTHVAYAFLQRDKCLQLAREGHMSEQRVYVRFARSWHRKAMNALQLERAAVRLELDYAREVA